MTMQVDKARLDESPQSLFANCDAWGAAEWFERLAMAVEAQDRAVIDKDDVRFEMYRNIASSSAMRLIRDHAPEVLSALRSLRSTEGKEEDDVVPPFLIDQLQYVDARQEPDAANALCRGAAKALAALTRSPE